jgi:hypothetical protein
MARATSTLAEYWFAETDTPGSRWSFNESLVLQHERGYQAGAKALAKRSLQDFQLVFPLVLGQQEPGILILLFLPTNRTRVDS